MLLLHYGEQIQIYTRLYEAGIYFLIPLRDFQLKKYPKISRGVSHSMPILQNWVIYFLVFP
ncbi:hypothetical protein AA650_21430 [Anabaena sp. WA102]|nr:hypothetical protein AA650_21430 [Anabaena sp. WA102]OBQ18462.1 MAG: hypothetical protein AN486_11955 [Anabaena sp. AL93]